jgi:hypothetical protein
MDLAADAATLTPEALATLLGGTIQWRWYADDGCHSVWQSREAAMRDRVEMSHPDARVERRVHFDGPWIEES